MDFLKDDLMFVNVFVLTFKESDKRLTLGLQSMMKLLGTVLLYISINPKSLNHYLICTALSAFPTSNVMGRENSWDQGGCLAVSSGATASSVGPSGAMTPGGLR